MVNTKIEAIVFDIGGVVYRAGDGPPLREKWAVRCGLDYSTFDEVVFNLPLYEKASIGVITREELWADRNRTLKLSSADLQELMNESWNGIWDERVLAYAKELSKRFKLGILSDATGGARERVAEWIDYSLFDAVVFSYEVGRRKPDPEIYKLTLKRLGVAAQNAIFIDDRPINIEGAQAVGMHAILYEEFEPFVAQIETMLRDF